MQNQAILKWILVSGVALLATLLGLIGYEVFSAVFQKEGIVITASEGASLRVNGRALEVLSGQAGITSFSPALLPLVTGLFAILVVFALIGAASLSRQVRQLGR